MVIPALQGRGDWALVERLAQRSAAAVRQSRVSSETHSSGPTDSAGQPPAWRPSPLVALAAALAAISAVALGIRLMTGGESGSSPSPAAHVATSAPTPNASAAMLPTASDEPDSTADPLSVSPCSADDLAMAAGGWGGATGSEAGGATLVNVSIDACRLSGKPAVELRSGEGVVASEGSPPSSDGDAVVLVPGAVTGVITVWSNWCGDPPALPLRLRLTLPDREGILTAVVRTWDVVRAQDMSLGGGSFVHVPRCNAPNAPSTIGVPLPFAATGPAEVDPNVEPCTADMLAGYLGPWGAAAGTMYANVVVLNRNGFDCAVAVSPPLQLRDAEGVLLATGERWANADSPVPLPPSRAAITMIGFANWCLAEPRLPFQLDLRIGMDRLAVAPTNDRSEIRTPFCNSAPQTSPPSLGYTGPFTIPGS